MQMGAGLPARLPEARSGAASRGPIETAPMRPVIDKLTHYCHRNGPEVHADDISGMYTSRWARRAASGPAELTEAVRIDFVPVLRSRERGSP